jgi:hypothetical protein
MKNSFKIFLTLAIFAMSTIAFSQSIKRLEIPLPNNAADIFTIPIQDKGVILMSQVGRTGFILTRFDTNLEKMWSVQGNIDANLDYVTNCYDGQNVYLLFSRFRTNVYEVVKINVGPGFIEKYQLMSVDKLEVSDFKAINNAVFIAGIVNTQPVILYSDLVARTIKILPFAAKEKSELQSIELDTLNKVVNATYAVGNRSKTYQLVVRSFDESGQQVSQFVLDPQDEFAMMNGRLNVESDSTELMLGTYGYKSSIGGQKGPYSQGIYFGKIMNDEVVDMKYHSFTDFKNFFNFLTPRQKERMEKKIESKKEKGDDVRLDYRMLMHDIMKVGDQYILVAEAFMPEYRYQNSYPYGGGLGNYGYSPFGFGGYNSLSSWGYGNYGLYSPYSSYYGYNRYRNQEVFDGYKFTHAIVAAFDKEGNLLWDNSIEIKDVKIRTLKEIVKAKIENNIVTLSYSNKGKIITKKIKGDEVIEDANEKDIDTNRNGDVIRQSTSDDIALWYDKFFLAFGVQKIKNDTEGERRNVFYLNKISF